MGDKFQTNNAPAANMFIHKLSNLTHTSNNAVAHLSLGQANVDFFTLVDIYTDLEIVIPLFNKALDESPKLAILNLIYLRDIVRGKGVRDLYKSLCLLLVDTHPDLVLDLAKLSLLTDLGRADDFHDLLLSDNQYVKESYALLIKECLPYNSLIAKWLPSIASKTNKTRKRQSNSLAKLWNLSPKRYRKLVSKLRSDLNLVESNLCNKNYEEIEYSKLPSLAMHKYTKAFKRNDNVRFSEYVQSLNSGDSKVNTKTLSPVDLIKKILLSNDFYYDNSYNDDSFLQNDEETLIINQWNSIKSKLNKTTKDTLVVADVSGSMSVRNNLPMATSIAAAILTSELLDNSYKNSFMTFTDVPRIHTFNEDDNLFSKVKQVTKQVGYNTNIEKVFNLIYELARDTGDMPDRLLLVSDMQFDEANESPSETKTLFKEFRDKIKSLGLNKSLEVVFWNVNADNFQIDSSHDSGIAMISGSAQGIFNLALTDDIPSPYQLMINTLVNTYSDNKQVRSIIDKIK